MAGSGGTLAIKVHRIEASFVDEGHKEKLHSVRFAVGGDDHRTKYKNHDDKIDQSLHFDVKDAAESEEVTIAVLQENRTKPLVSTKLPLSDFFAGFVERKMTFTFGPKAAPNTVLLFFNVQWSPSAPAVVEETVLSTETHRPWYTRVSYYYDTSKSVYNYATSFRVVAPFARFGESTANAVLTTVTGKTLRDLDQSLVSPVLDTVDNKVDATISVAFTKLYEGQQYILQKKDAALGLASTAAKKTGETASTAVSSTVSTAGAAKNYTTGKVVAVASAVSRTVSGVAESVSTQVVHASSSTYGAVRGVATSALSYLPVIGPKIRA